MNRVEISTALESSERLANRWPHRVKLSDPAPKEGSVAILNLMPDKKLHEYLWLDLLIEAGLDGPVSFVTTQSYHPKSVDPQYLSLNYVTAMELKDSPPRAWIITGAPLGTRLDRFEDAAYWSELAELFDRNVAQDIPTLGVCWGGNALFHHLYGIPLQRLERKAIGTFPHLTGADAPDFGLQPGQTLQIPVARKSGFPPAREVRAYGVTCDLDGGDDLGPTLLRSPNNRQWAICNHLEYDLATLISEHQRDIGRGLNFQAQMNHVSLNSATDQAPWRETAVSIYRAWLDSLPR